MVKITYTIMKDNSFNPILSYNRKEKFAYWFTRVHLKPDGEHPTSIESYQASLKKIAELLSMSEDEFYSVTSTTLIRSFRNDLLNFEIFKNRSQHNQDDLQAIHNTYILFNKWLVLQAQLNLPVNYSSAS